MSKVVHINKVGTGEILEFMLKKCSGKKIYYVHNLTFEAFVFMRELVDRDIKFKIVSANKTVYSMSI